LEREEKLKMKKGDFDGVDDRGNVVQLLQHYSQMALMLVAVPKLDETPFRKHQSKAWPVPLPRRNLTKEQGTVEKAKLPLPSPCELDLAVPVKSARPKPQR
jgi:hypothetical protein